VIAEPTSSNLLWHTFSSLLSFVLVGSLILVGGAWALKRNPKLMALLNLRWNKASASPDIALTQLAIEESLPLEPQKTLYVVRYGHERFLIAAGMAETHFLTRLGGNDPGITHHTAQPGHDEETFGQHLYSNVAHPTQPTAGTGPQFFQTLKDNLPKTFMDQTVPSITRPGNRPHHDHPHNP
jgi:Flagellar biosynthesis protein, FliO